MNLKYSFGALLSIPLLPLMYYQGKRIRSRVPQLPEASGREGHCTVPNAAGKPLKLLAIGESTIAGVGVETHAEGFTGTFAQELALLLQREVDWKVYARSGYTASRVTKKILPKITESEADILLIGLGGNDAFTLNRPSKWSKEIRALIEKIQKAFPEALIVFCNMPPIKAFPAFTSLIKWTIGNLVEILGEELQKVSQAYPNVVYMNEKLTLQAWIEKYALKEGEKAFFSDGVHPSKLTYQVWAKDIARSLWEQKVLQERL